MGFPLTPRSMTLDHLELYKFEFSVNFLWILQISDATTAKRMKIGQYCQQFLACFRVARICQRQLGFLVVHNDDEDDKIN